MTWTYQTVKVKVDIPEGLDIADLRLLYFDRRTGEIKDNLSVDEAIKPYLLQGVIGIGKLSGQAVVVRFEFREEKATLIATDSCRIRKGVNAFAKLHEKWGLKCLVLGRAIGHLCPTGTTGEAKWEGKSKWGR